MTEDYSTLFWLLVFTACVSLLGIISTAKSLKSLVKSDFFLDKLKELKESDSLKTIILIALSVLPGSLLAQAGEAVEYPAVFEIGYNEVFIMAVINIVLILVIFFLKKMLNDMLKMVIRQKEGVQEEELTSKINQVLTDAVPIDQEHTILMDHDYDGIQELDNNLPPWWKWGFYATIVFAVVYLFNYHVLGTGDLQLAEYEKDVAQSEMDVIAYLESMSLNVDENSAVDMLDAEDLKSGRAIYVKNCAVCHLEDGGGQVGPNLTDDHWLYGPDMKSIFKTVKYGANNGMTAWKEKLTPVEIQQVSSYIRTLHGTTPAVPKDPQGTLMDFVPIGGGEAQPAIVADSLAVN